MVHPSVYIANYSPHIWFSSSRIAFSVDKWIVRGTTFCRHVRNILDSTGMSPGHVPIDAINYRSVKGFNQYFTNSVNKLSDDKSLSSYYLVPNPNDQSYIDAGSNDMRILNMVDEKDRV